MPVQVTNAHLWSFGHLALGFHTHLETRDRLGVRGEVVEKEYKLAGFNLTPVPVPVQVCLEGSDVGYYAVHRYRSEKRTASDPRWIRLEEPLCGHDGRQDPREWRIWWPGTARVLSEGRLATHPQNRDRFRLTAFTIFDLPGDHWCQLRLESEEQVSLGPASPGR